MGALFTRHRGKALGLVGAFSPTWRTITCSRRFHPPNTPPRPGDVYDTREQAADLAALVEALEAGGAVAVGSSFGAYIALVAALARPGLFRALVLCEPPMVPLLLRHERGRPLHDAFVRDVMEPSRAAFREGRPEEGLAIFIDGIRGQPGSFRRMLPGIRTDLLRFIPELRAEFLSPHEHYMVEVSREALGTLRTPALLIGGALSTPMFGAILDVLQREIPRTSRALIPRAGHLSHLQNPAAFTAAVMEFLAPLRLTTPAAR